VNDPSPVRRTRGVLALGGRGRCEGTTVATVWRDGLFGLFIVNPILRADIMTLPTSALGLSVRIVGRSRTRSASPLRAMLRVPQSHVAHIQDLDVEVALTNPSPPAVRWLGSYVRAGSPALEVRDASCGAVPAGPPPTPRVDDGVTDWNTLDPGDSLTFAFHRWVLSEVLSGRYEVRFSGVPGDKSNTDVRAAWVPLEVVAADGGT